MYPCPVCGYLTFAEPPGSYDVCVVCHWEDDALQLEYATSLAGGANSVTLMSAQLAFQRAADRLLRKRGSNTFKFGRDPDWRPIDTARDRFPDWDDDNAERPATHDESLYYWRDSFWRRDAST
jgi:hypothetical protein